jgi:hypothetical protein
VEPKVKALEETIARRLGITPNAAGGPAAPAPQAGARPPAKK